MDRRIVSIMAASLFPLLGLGECALIGGCSALRPMSTILVDLNTNAAKVGEHAIGGATSILAVVVNLVEAGVALIADQIPGLSQMQTANEIKEEIIGLAEPRASPPANWSDPVQDTNSIVRVAGIQEYG